MYPMIPPLLFLDISGGEILLILIVVFIVFGPGKIPEIARKLGKGLNEVKKASNQIRDEINREVNTVKDTVSMNTDDAIKQQRKPHGKNEPGDGDKPGNTQQGKDGKGKEAGDTGHREPHDNSTEDGSMR